MLTYVDVSHSDDDREDHPDVVAGFEALGFERVGRVLSQPAMPFEELAASFAEPDASAFMAHTTVPTPVLRSPGGDAFVDVSWFWDGPSVRLRTRLLDGSLAETLLRWVRQPEPRPGAATLGQRLLGDTDARMTLGNDPAGGRSIRVIPDPSPAALAAEHERHVREYAAARQARPARHEELHQWMSIAEEAYAAELDTVKLAVADRLTPIGFIRVAHAVAWLLCVVLVGGVGAVRADERLVWIAVGAGILGAASILGVERLARSLGHGAGRTDGPVHDDQLG